MATRKNISDVFEEKARSGDGAFAIAYAVLKLTEQTKEATLAIDRIGMNRLAEGRMQVPGTLEMLALEAGRIASALEQAD